MLHRRDTRDAFSRLDGNLQALARSHLVKCLLELFELVDVCDHSLGFNLPTVEVLYRTGEAESLRERADNLSSAI